MGRDVVRYGEMAHLDLKVAEVIDGLALLFEVLP